MKQNFIWGAATAAFQIEGAARLDGKGLSIWDHYTRLPGRIYRDHHADIACDHYHRFKEDVALMAKLGIKAYRFSLSWPRILPKGIGEINLLGLKFYDDLLDELAKYEIVPYVTLFHWDLPLELQKKGGWLNSESSEWFKEYAEVVSKHFKGKIRHFITLNEPQIIINHGLQTGLGESDYKLTTKDYLQAIHNLLLAHGKANIAVRKNIPNATIGFAPCSDGVIPQRNDQKLEEACYEFYYQTRFGNYHTTALYSDPVFLGDYPKEYYEIYQDYLPKITPEDLKIISTPVDYCYQNTYTGAEYDFDKLGQLVKIPFIPGSPQAHIEWEDVVPEALYYVSKFLARRYQKPIMISENGMCCHDAISLDGQVKDPNRINYIQRYLLQIQKAVYDAIDVSGYFYWSLLDNFEWSAGFSKRFGLIYIDYQNLHRTPKLSFYYYQKVIASNGKYLSEIDW